MVLLVVEGRREVSSCQMTEEQRDKKQSQDDIINKLMVGAVIGLLTWNIYTTQELTIKVAVLAEKMERIEQELLKS